MTDNKLQNITEKLENLISKDTATFGIFRHGGDSDESYIEANKQGLLIFATQLLKAANSFDDLAIDINKQKIPLEFEGNWIDDRSDTLIQYIKPITERQTYNKANDEKTFFDNLIPIGCFAFAFFILIALLIGLWTFYKWIF